MGKTRQTVERQRLGQVVGNKVHHTMDPLAVDLDGLSGVHG